MKETRLTTATRAAAAAAARRRHRIASRDMRETTRDVRGPKHFELVDDFGSVLEMRAKGRWQKKEVFFLLFQ